MRRALYFGLLAAAGLLCISGASAQSANTPAQNKSTTATTQTKEVDPALLAKAKTGDASAEYDLGSAYENGKGAPQDYEQASQWYEKAALQGYAPAQYAFGLMYERNKGIPQDYGEAYFWLSLAAKANPTDKALSQAAVIAARDNAARHLPKDTIDQVQTQVDGFTPIHPK